MALFPITKNKGKELKGRRRNTHKLINLSKQVRNLITFTQSGNVGPKAIYLGGLKRLINNVCDMCFDLI